MSKHVIEDIKWHSCIDLGDDNVSAKQLYKIPVSSMGQKFIKAHKDSSFLIHKSTKALWRFSDDGKYIKPVFEEDILTEGNL